MIGEIRYGGSQPLVGNQGLRTDRLEVTSVSDRAIQVTSHFHFFEVNRALRFDRRRALGMHLDIPPGMSVRFEPGASATVQLVEYAGARRVVGFNRLVEGSLADVPPETALERARAAGFLSPSPSVPNGEG
jgi:urease subunit beta